MKQAKVTLRQESIDRLVCGKTVTIRLRDIELELRFDSLANLGEESIENVMNDILRGKQRRRG